MIDIYRHYREFAERKGLPWIEPAPLVNEVDHRAFNYSLEEPILREFGAYDKISHYYNFSTVQPCMRGGDISRIKRGETHSHLSLFHMMPLAFSMLPDSKQVDRYHSYAIRTAIEFFESIALNKEDLEVRYFLGGRLDDIGDGIVIAKEKFPEDKTTKREFIRSGLKESQLIGERSLNTFVSTFTGSQEFFAGYRYEIYYRHPIYGLLEIATGEALRYWQKKNSRGITVSITPFRHGAAPLVIGMERILAAMEGITILEISPIKELAHALYPLLRDRSLNPLRCADMFRTVCLLMAQTVKLKLSSSQKRQRRSIISQLCKCFDSSVQAKDLSPAVRLNEKLHPWHATLVGQSSVIAEAIAVNIQRRRINA